MGEAGGLNLYGYVGNDPINEFDSYGLDSNATTFRFLGVKGSLADALSFTHFNASYYKLSPEEQNATRVHEDIHLYDPNQFPPLNSSKSREIDATTKEINYINGQIAALTLQQQQELQSDCPSKQRLHDLGIQIFNYGNALTNAQENLDYYQSHSNSQILVDALNPF